ncbi:MAG: DUF885 domain-containing protein, partial [Dokdonella sp.]
MFVRRFAAAVLSCGFATVALAQTPGSADATPAWVTQSNLDAQPLLKAMAQFRPEYASRIGLAGYDEKSIDLKPDLPARERTALGAARAELQAKLASETDGNVRRDLELMIKAAERAIESNRLREKYLLPYQNVGQTIFQGEFGLLQDQVAAERRVAALKRLECYVGITPGCTSLTKEAEAAYVAKLTDRQLLSPYKAQVEQDLANTTRYIDGVRKLYEKYRIDGAEPALVALKKQLRAHDAWVTSNVLAHARTDFRLPPELYANNLKDVGLDITPEELIRKAEIEFMETRAQMQMLAPVVAKAEGSDATDFHDVLKLLKKQQLDRASIETYYHDIIGKVEAIIRDHGLVSLPQRAMIMRLASEAESAASPAPHMQPPPLIDNHGERGSFILPLGNPPKDTDGGNDEVYDDFTCKACAWTLTSHEGRPGHELQFSAMVEHGVSLARSLFAQNSVNVEGWALYSEYMMLPFEPPAGQMIALQMRQQRAARAILDPMLNLGLITRERAHDVIVNEVGLSEALAREELDRFMFRSPGQATAYFYGYTRLLELRAHVELAQGKDFNLKALNDFIIAQGLLPPDQLQEAVEAGFLHATK